MTEMRLPEKLLVNKPLCAWLQRREVANLHRPEHLAAPLTLERDVGRPVTPVFDMVGVARKAA